MTRNEKPKILLVDDDSFLLDMYTKKFNSSGYETATCSDVDDCLNQLRDGSQLDILIVDIIMPKMSGLDLLEVIKKEVLSPNSLKIILTNQGQPEDVKKVEGLGVDGYIVKALFTPTKVVEKINEIYKNR